MIKSCKNCEGAFEQLPKQRVRLHCSNACARRYASRKHYHRAKQGLPDRRCESCAELLTGNSSRWCPTCAATSTRSLTLHRNHQRYQGDEEYRRYCKLQAVARRARIRAATIVLFTPAQLADRLSMYSGCWICGDPRWTEADHVKPLAKGGPHMLANIRPACSTCNRAKGATWPFSTRKVA